MNSTEDKIILRKAYQDAWTAEIAQRGKNGFAASVTEWLKQPDVKSLSDDLLKDHSNPMYQFLSFERTQKMLNQNLQHWSLLVLALWFKNNYKLFE